jgi:hypothetical protein
MKPEERFAQRLCGITAREVAGLLSSIMRRENFLGASVSKGKRVRQWKANLIGIPITVREVNASYVPLNSIPAFMRSDKPKYLSDVEYVIENPEWEFSVLMRSASEFVFENDPERDAKLPPGGNAKLGSYAMHFSFPEFDGDMEAYKSNMSLIRLMGLENDCPEDVMVF